MIFEKICAVIGATVLLSFTFGILFLAICYLALVVNERIEAKRVKKIKDHILLRQMKIAITIITIVVAVLIYLHVRSTVGIAKGLEDMGERQDQFEQNFEKLAEAHNALVDVVFKKENGKDTSNSISSESGEQPAHHA